MEDHTQPEPATPPNTTGSTDVEAIRGDLRAQIKYDCGTGPKPPAAPGPGGLLFSQRELPKVIAEREELKLKLAGAVTELAEWKDKFYKYEAVILSADRCAAYHGFARKGHEPGDELQPNIRDMGDAIYLLKTELTATKAALAEAKQIARENYDSANAYMEISTKVRGDNDALKKQLAELGEQAHEKTKTSLDDYNKAVTILREQLAAATQRAESAEKLLAVLMPVQGATTPWGWEAAKHLKPLNVAVLREVEIAHMIDAKFLAAIEAHRQSQASRAPRAGMAATEGGK